KGKASGRLATAFIRNADQSGTVVTSGAALDQRAFGSWPKTRAVIDVGKFVQHRGQHFAADGAVRTISLFGCSAAIGEAGKQVAVEVELGYQRCLAVGVARHVIGPADVDAPVELFDEPRR